MSRSSRLTWHTWSRASRDRSASRASGSSSTAQTVPHFRPHRRRSRPKGLRFTGSTPQPDGININESSGSTHMDSLRAAVLERHADIGIALDGDADRCLAVDTFGRIVDGDQILAILALALREQGRLKNDTVVATVMSNLGLINAMRSRGITCRTDQGRRSLRLGGHEGWRLHSGR